MAEVLYATVGADFQEPLALTDRAGTPTDLTGADLKWLAKGRIDDPDVDAVLTATSGGGTIVVDAPPTAGQLHFAIPAAATAALDPTRRYVWTLEVESAGVVTRYPDGFQRGPGVLYVTPSAIIAQP